MKRRCSAISGEITQKDIIVLLGNYSDYLSSRTGYLIDPTIEKLLRERISFYNELFNVGLNSELHNIKSEFSSESMKVTDRGGIYYVRILERVTLTGKYNLDKVDEYPIIQASQWAIKQTDDQKVINTIENEG
jgi:hypothetical protein